MLTLRDLVLTAPTVTSSDETASRCHRLPAGTGPRPCALRGMALLEFWTGVEFILTATRAAPQPAGDRLVVARGTRVREPFLACIVMGRSLPRVVILAQSTKFVVRPAPRDAYLMLALVTSVTATTRLPPSVITNTV